MLINRLIHASSRGFHLASTASRFTPVLSSTSTNRFAHLQLSQRFLSTGKGLSHFSLFSQKYSLFHLATQLSHLYFALLFGYNCTMYGCSVPCTVYALTSLSVLCTSTSTCACLLTRAHHQNGCRHASSYYDTITSTLRQLFLCCHCFSLSMTFSF